MSDERTLAQPAEPIATSIARIYLHDDGAITIFFPEKREDFRNIIKPIGFRWQGSGQWKREVDIDAQQDRAAELAYLLLKAGYRVDAPVAVIESAVQKSFQPEPTRVISAIVGGEYKGWFRIWWRRDEDCYDIARKLPGSRYRGQGCDVVVPSSSFTAVSDFATMHHFHLTAGAHELIAQAEAEWESALVVVIEDDEPTKPAPKPLSNKRPVLAAPEDVDIDPALLDEWEEEEV